MDVSIETYYGRLIHLHVGDLCIVCDVREQEGRYFFRRDDTGSFPFVCEYCLNGGGWEYVASIVGSMLDHSPLVLFQQRIEGELVAAGAQRAADRAAIARCAQCGHLLDTCTCEQPDDEDDDRQAFDSTGVGAGVHGATLGLGSDETRRLVAYAVYRRMRDADLPGDQTAYALDGDHAAFAVYALAGAAGEQSGGTTPTT